MEKILLLVHTDNNGNLHKSMLEALAAALKVSEKLGGVPLSAAIIGAGAAAAAEQLAGSGADKVYIVSGDEFTTPRYSSDSAAAEAVCREAGATVVIAAGTSRWNRVLSGVAFRLGGRVDTHVIGISEEEDLSVNRWFYRQRIRAAVSRTERPWILAIDPGSFEAWSGSGVSAETVEVEVALPDVPRVEVIGEKKPVAGEETIKPDAALLLVAGAGWTKVQPDGTSRARNAEELILGFLRNARASLGGSKSMVDQSSEGEAVLSFMTHLNQIGQTGSTPRHQKGLATCCHGEEPHAVGWRFINERRAINLDPNCGWAQGKADVLYVADSFKVLEKVNELLG
ncbi:MAG: electron transfer flavoprotein subunit alpha [Acidobacteriota bacterium]